MSSLSLLLWIVSGILLQLAIYLGYRFWQHWLDYLALRRTAVPASDEAEAMAPAWQGLRSFQVVQKQVEDAGKSICSFYLAPQDGLALAPFQPGQFLTFRLELPTTGGGTSNTIRCYSLSDAPEPGRYRISVKRALAPAGSPHAPGRSSNFFHDHVEVGSVLKLRAPAGHFYVDRSDAPVVLIGGGIGITPMMSMLNACLRERPEREVWLFYGVRNSREVAWKSDLENLVTSHANFHLQLCWSDPLPEDVLGRDFQQRGHVDMELLRRQLPLKPFHFYICGPTAMLQSLVPALEDWGVPDQRIHFEAFGPHRFGASRQCRCWPLCQTRRRAWSSPFPDPASSCHGRALPARCWSSPRRRASKSIPVAALVVAVPARRRSWPERWRIARRPTSTPSRALACFVFARQKPA